VLLHFYPRYAGLSVQPPTTSDVVWFVRKYYEAVPMFMINSGQYDYIGMIVNRALQRYAEACLDFGVVLFGVPEMTVVTEQYPRLAVCIIIRANVGG